MKKEYRVKIALFSIILLILNLVLIPKKTNAVTEQKILYVGVNKESQNKAAVFTMNKDGSDKKDLTGIDGPSAASFPLWSPDGSKIAYLDFSDLGTRLMVMDREGSNKVVASGEGVLSSDEPIISHFTWNKDSSKIFFSSVNANYLNQSSPTLSEGAVKVFSTGTDGSNPTQIAYYEPSSTSEYLRARVEYDNKHNKLVVTLVSSSRAYGGGGRYSSWESISINPDGSGIPQQLVSGTDGDIISFSASPSGSKILYSQEKYIGDGVSSPTVNDFQYPLAILDTDTLNVSTIPGNYALWIYGSLPWAQSEDKIFTSTAQFGGPYTDQKVLSLDGTALNNISLPGTRNYPTGQFVDNDKRLLLSVITDSNASNPNDAYIALYDINSGQVADLSSGGDIGEYYASISSLELGSSSPEPVFTDPPKPPKTGILSWVGLALIVSLSLLTLSGHTIARRISRRIHNTSER
ncbi:MAG: PD40 domain-containing protein [Candidatus Nomurabacteria bacterium]|nr:MAG: PD40 domain-containing protein [Candidatus Nomurabacteria bacterium]HRV75808.1 hypothetical protein [Candidatus Saccharimonadales bacterium]